jgi:hypothetical protein
MKRLKKVTGHCLDMSDYGLVEKFDVYELGDYDFSNNIDFGDCALKNVKVSCEQKGEWQS